MKLNIQLFASSKTITKTIKDSYNNSYTVTATINESLPSDYITTNKTLLSGSVKVSNTGSGGAYTSSKAMSATLSFLAENSSGASLASATGSCAFDFQGSSTKTATPLTYNNLEITHNADGSRTVYIKLVLKITETSLKQTQTYTDTLALTTIPRASSITSVSAGTTPYSPSIVWTPYSSSFKFKVKYRCGDNIFESSLISPNTTNAYTYSGLQITDGAFTGIDDDELTATATLYTYQSDGTTPVGSPATKTFSVTLSDSVEPTVSITNITASGSPSTWDVYVQNKTILSYKVNCSPADPSASTMRLSTGVKVTNIKIDNPSSVNNITTPPINVTGTASIIAALTDSRGRTATATSNSFTVAAYSDPVINIATITRCDANGNTSDSGTKVKYRFTGSISTISGRNSKTFRIGYRIKGSSSSYTYKTISTDYTVNVTNETVISDWTFSTDNAYEFAFEAIDSFRTSSNPVRVERTIETGFDLMNFNASGKAMAIGKVSEAESNEELLEIALPTKYTEDVSIDGDLMVRGETIVDSIKSKNLLNNFSFVKGRITSGTLERVNYISSIVSTKNSVAFTTTSTWSGITSDFIEVKQGNYTISGVPNKKIFYYVEAYNSSKVWQSRLVENNASSFFNYTFSIPSGIKYIRLVFQGNVADTYTITNLMIENSSTATTYSPYQELDIDNLAKQELVVGNIRGSNLFNYTMTPVYYDNTSVSLISPNGIKVIAGGSGTTYSMAVYKVLNTDDYLGKTITLSCNVNVATGQPRIAIGTCNSAGGNRSMLASKIISSNDRHSITATMPTSTTSTTKYVYVGLNVSRGTSPTSGDYSEFTNIQLNIGNNTTYSPYQNLNGMETYSTNEQVVGTWIDGKPIYRKVISYTNSSTIGASNKITDIDIPHKISNIGTAISVKGLIGGVYDLPYLDGDGTKITKATWVSRFNTTNIILRILNDTWSSRTSYFILEYTKTTD